MKQKRLGRRIAAWLLCLAMVLTTINLPAFVTEVKAAQAPTTLHLGDDVLQYNGLSGEDNTDDLIWKSFTASEAGVYRFVMTTPEDDLILYLKASDGSTYAGGVNAEVCYMNAGDTVNLAVADKKNEERSALGLSINLSVTKEDNILKEGDNQLYANPVSSSSLSDKFLVWYEFTANETGDFMIYSAGNPKIYVTTDLTSVDEIATPYNLSVIEGQKYYIAFSEAKPKTTRTFSVMKNTSVLKEGNNTFTSSSALVDWLDFTPQETGLYTFRKMNGMQVTIYVGATEKESDCKTTYGNITIALEKDKTYKIGFSGLGYYNTCIVNVKRTDENLKVGNNEIAGNKDNKDFALYKFRPSQDGIYCIKADVIEKGGDYERVQLWKNYSLNDNSQRIENCDIDSCIVYKLKKDIEYFIRVDTAGIYNLSIEHASSVLSLGKNDIYRDGYNNTWYEFTATETGTYIVSSDVIGTGIANSVGDDQNWETWLEYENNNNETKSVSRELTAGQKYYISTWSMDTEAGNITVYINKPMSVDKLTYTAPANLAYTGTGKTATVTGETGVGEITVKYVTANGDVADATTTAPSAVGSYDVYADVAPGEVYSAGTYKVGTFTITKGTYDTPVAPTVASSNCTSVTLTAVDGCEYSIDGSNWQDGVTFSNLTPNTTYTFYQRMKANDNYNVSTASSTSLTTGNHDFLDQDGINDPSIEACASCGVKNINFSGLDSSVGAVDKEYTGSGITPEIIIKNLIQDTDYTVEDVTKTEPGEYEIKVTGKGDYAGERIVSWKIIPGEPTLIIPTPTAQYKQKLSDVEIVNPEGNVEGTWNWKNPDEVVTAIGESTFVAIFTPADTTKWNVVEKDIIVNVNKASYAPSEEYSKSFIYSGEYIDEIIDLSRFVAEDAVEVSFAVTDKTFTGTDTVTEAVIDGNNLKFSLAKMDAYAENTSTTIFVAVSTANYQDYTKVIKITRSDCDHPEDMIVLEHVILPGCETAGEDARRCTKCNEVIESGIVVQALGHDYIDGVCSRCDVISLELCKDINVDVTSVLYNETAQTPEVKVTYKGIELVEGTDYILTVNPETAIGTYELSIEGTGDYRDTIKKNWSVLPAKGLYCAAIPDQVYTGKAIKPTPEVYCDGIKLTAGKDYTIAYKNNVKTAASDAKDSKGRDIAPSVTITGKGNYSDKHVLTFNIVPCSIDEVTVDDITVAKTGKAIKIAPVVKLNGKVLKLGTDYVVSSTESMDDAVASYKDPGKYDLWIVGKSNYAGTVPFKFTITEKTLTSKVSIKKIVDQKYDDGNALTPALEVTYKIGGKVTDVTDNFNVVYKNNTEIGTATVIITAKPESTLFEGSKTVTFKITGAQIKNVKLGENGKGIIPAKIYDGVAYEPVLDLYDGTTPLVKDVDYTVIFTKNVNVGTATAKVTGKGNYTGTKNFSYKITKYDATADSKNMITVDDFATSVVDIKVNYEKGGVTPKPVVKFGGTELKEKTDYTLSYANNKAVAAKDAKNSKGKDIAPTIIITFKGNLAGKQAVKFEIEGKNISEGKMTIADKPYSTKANAWKQTAVTIVDTNGKKLVAGTDYNKTFRYYSNDEYTNEITDSTLAAKTEVYVEVTGINNYAGSIIKGSYRISERSIAKVSASIDPQTFTGTEIRPKAEDIKVWVGTGKNKTELIAGEDYEVIPGSYKNNTNKGTATVTIVGKGDYYGTKVIKFTIGTKKFLWWII